jgi:hypothetical protein
VILFQPLLLAKNPFSGSSKFSSLSDIYTKKILNPSYSYFLRAPTFLDRVNLCEKFEVIPSADEMLAIKYLHNTIAHKYLNENLIEIYIETIRLSDRLLMAILETEKFYIKIKV